MKRHPSLDFCSNFKVPTQQTCAFFHASNNKTLLAVQFLGVETDTFVTYGDIKIATNHTNFQFTFRPSSGPRGEASSHISLDAWFVSLAAAPVLI